MNVTEAAAQWEEAKRQVDEWVPKLRTAEAVLKPYFRKTGRKSFRGRIGFAMSMVRHFSQDKARDLLGDDADKCVEYRRRETLSLLVSDEPKAKAKR